ncbi:MAG: Do family serine endopeptidase [Helicobacteraceae bacterium]|jgi:serine protease Do|nr:Do family serine endopeptidase [Helicobacteraceae bacterium]
MFFQPNFFGMHRTVFLSTVLLVNLNASSITFNDASEITQRTMPADKQILLSYNSAVKEATKSIVYISTTQVASMKRQQMHPFFEQFFDQDRTPRHYEPRQGLGSGVIVSEDGYIVTNNHVIENADEITVQVNGSNAVYIAEVIGKDPKSDIAVIKIKTDKKLHPILMGRSDMLKIGDVVFAIGNPFGVGQSVTQGIISAQHKDSVGINEYENFIQTDASINPGNSGGALVDSRGALIGINSAIMTRSGGNNGIGFAIESDMVRNITKQLIENGTIERGYLGVAIGDLTSELQKLYKNAKGAMVIQVNPDSPAEKSDLQRGDLITKIDTKEIDNAAALKNIIGQYRPNSTVTVTYERDTKDNTVNVKLGNLQKVGVSAQTESTLINGAQFSDLDSNTRFDYRIAEDVEGVLVAEVDIESEACNQNIRRGDVIMQVEKKLTPDLETLNKVLKKYQSIYKRIYINRNGRIYVTVLK